MKSILTMVAAGLLAGSFVVSADAATKKSQAMAQQQAQCQAMAKKKYSAVHFLKRREFVKQCMARMAQKA